MTIEVHELFGRLTVDASVKDRGEELFDDFVWFQFPGRFSFRAGEGVADALGPLYGRFPAKEEVELDEEDFAGLKPSNGLFDPDKELVEAPILVYEGAIAPRPYRPLLDEPGLFRRFAELDDGSVEDLEDFASRFGPLFGNRSPFPGTKESLYWWRRLIIVMRLGVVGLDEGPEAALEAGFASSIPTTLAEVFDDARLPPLRGGVPLRTAWAHLVGMWAARFSFTPILIPGKNRGFDYRLIPDCLAGAMWLQFLQAAAWEKTYRKCPICGRLIEISRAPTTGCRRSRKYCSDKCRQTAFRRRRAKG